MTSARRYGSPDDGRVSLLLAVALIGILTIIGLSFDGAGQLRSMQRADNVAAEAARTGGQAIDIGRAVGGGSKVLDEDKARAAVQAYVATISGATVRSITFAPSGQELTVVVDLTYNTIFLDLIGFPDLTVVQGRATARLLTEP